MEKIPSEITKEEAVHIGTKATLSAIPILGGPAVELFNAIIASPLSKRRDEWMNKLAEMVDDLKAKVEGFSPDALSENEQFISGVMQATQIYLRNHQIEKKQALLNAIRKVALNKAPEEDIQTMFWNYIDTLTPWHLRLLAYFKNPRKWGEENKIKYPNWVTGGHATLLEHTFPEFRGKRDIYEKIYTDLRNYGLVNQLSLGTTITPDGMFQSSTTNLGNQFLDFISE